MREDWRIGNCPRRTRQIRTGIWLWISLTLAGFPVKGASQAQPPWDTDCRTSTPSVRSLVTEMNEILRENRLGDRLGCLEVTADSLITISMSSDPWSSTSRQAAALRELQDTVVVRSPDRERPYISFRLPCLNDPLFGQECSRADFFIPSVPETRTFMSKSFGISMSLNRMANRRIYQLLLQLLERLPVVSASGTG